MQILISDANVIIDMEDSGLTELMFNLPYQFALQSQISYFMMSWKMSIPTYLSLV